jgi:hypothetical protein
VMRFIYHEYQQDFFTDRENYINSSVCLVSTCQGLNYPSLRLFHQVHTEIL